MVLKSVDNKILSALKGKELNILELSVLIKKDRHTTAKYLEVLKSKGLINYKTRGKSKIWFSSKNPLSELLNMNSFISSQVLGVLNNLDYAVSIQSRDFVVVWHNDKLKNKYGENNGNQKCYELIKGRRVPCKNCISEKTFNTGEIQKSLKGNDLKSLVHPIKNEQGEVLAVIKLSKINSVGGVGL